VDDSGPATLEHAILYSGGTMTDLEHWGPSSGAIGINSSGEIVGVAYTANYYQQAFLYANGK